ncbi:DUF4920 domain-containing protein [Flavobacteriales bacterium]|jgi:hypothetical protein|nr:DUF4920 domain-containing protein [Flavobacteriales bacterium]MDB2653216.1 DUF4920 domain-containing protein [Flavobacteriales bacterium]
MKTTLTALSIATLFACGSPKQKKVETYFGEKITSENIHAYSDLLENVAKTGVVEAKIEGEIIETCAKKGCWMKMRADNDTLMVRFKDYGFFVPKEGVDGKHVIVNGEAFYDTLTVDLLRHYAEDAGKTEEEIMTITEPEYVLSFTANGVIIQE